MLHPDKTDSSCKTQQRLTQMMLTGQTVKLLTDQTVIYSRDLRHKAQHAQISRQKECRRSAEGVQRDLKSSEGMPRWCKKTVKSLPEPSTPTKHIFKHKRQLWKKVTVSVPFVIYRAIWLRIGHLWGSNARIRCGNYRTAQTLVVAQVISEMSEGEAATSKLGPVTATSTLK